MALQGDPYRILGLPPGAPLAEVKRAYRRLAKIHHPDTAGEAAIPRFLAIQAAYEALVGDDGRGRRGPGVARPAPWQADPDRARATRAGWGTRGRAGRRPETDQADDPSARRPPPNDTTEAGASSGARWRRQPGSRRAGGDRPPDRATPGSTSYDYADQDPYDPAWTGASWYGQSSGTYWTINPKEYADPRKHGPEYQARGRRVASPGESPPSFEGDTSAGPPSPPDRGGAFASAAVEDPIEALIRAPGTTSRIVLALIGWPPIGLALALLIGELSGCGRFAASCVESISIAEWIGQLAIIALLLLVPSFASVAAVGTVAVLAAAIPVAVVLSAVGGTRRPDAAAGVLLVLLAAAWVGGVVVAIARRSRTVGG